VVEASSAEAQAEVARLQQRVASLETSRGDMIDRAAYEQLRSELGGLEAARAEESSKHAAASAALRGEIAGLEERMLSASSGTVEVAKYEQAAAELEAARKDLEGLMRRHAASQESIMELHARIEELESGEEGGNESGTEL
jgi:chromosome segregation ATPase